MDIVEIINGGFLACNSYTLVDKETFFLIGERARKKNNIVNGCCIDVEINVSGETDGSRIFIKDNIVSGSGEYARLHFLNYEIPMKKGEICAFAFDRGTWKRFL